MENIVILRLPEVCKITGLSRSSVYRAMNDENDDFPRPVRLSTRSVGWKSDAVMAWLDSRAEA